MRRLLRRFCVHLSIRYAHRLVRGALARQWRDADDKRRNRWYWGATGADVASAASAAGVAISRVAVQGSGEVYIRAVLTALDSVLEAIRMGPDPDGFKAGTIGELQQDIERRAGLR